MQLPLHYDKSVVSCLRTAKSEAGRRAALADSSDLLVGILSQEQLPITRILNSLGITIEVVRAHSMLTSTEEEECEHEEQRIRESRATLQNAYGWKWQPWWSLTSMIRAGLERLAGPSPYAPDAIQTFRRAMNRSLEQKKNVVAAEDFVWAIALSPRLRKVFQLLGIEAASVHERISGKFN